MDNDRTANLLGALVLALADALAAETATRAEHGSAAPAALVTIGVVPGDSIHALAEILALSHSATVRLVDRLAADGLVERRGGADGRTAALHLTPRGQARRRTILEGRQTILHQALAPLGDGDRAVLTGLIETMLGRLPRDRRHADHICRLCDEDACPGATCPVEGAVAPAAETGSGS